MGPLSNKKLCRNVMWHFYSEKSLRKIIDSSFLQHFWHVVCHVKNYTNNAGGLSGPAVYIMR